MIVNNRILYIIVVYIFVYEMNNQIVKKQQNYQVVETRRDRQIAKGIVVAMSCEILKINDETYRVQSEKAVDRFYVVRFSDGEPNYCTV